RQDPLPARDLRTSAVPDAAHGRHAAAPQCSAGDRAARHGGRAGGAEGNGWLTTEAWCRRRTRVGGTCIRDAQLGAGALGTFTSTSICSGTPPVSPPR